MCAFGFIGRHQERTVSRTSKKSGGSPTGGESEAQSRERQTESNQKITKDWVGWECMGLTTVGRVLVPDGFQFSLRS